jgi:hypothetical protein
VRTLADVHGPTEVGAGGDVNSLTQVAVVIHGGACVEDRESANARIDVHDGAGHDDAAIAD